MTAAAILRCDGCGQVGSPEHIARRLRRLEWATRYRPVHIQTLLLGGAGPRDDAEFLYAPGGEFRGEGGALVRAVGIRFAGKSAETVHDEFQSGGLFLTHILECPLEDGPKSTSDAANILREHLPSVASRIRRSLKPKHVMLVTEMPQDIVQDILAVDLGCEVILNDGKPFALTPSLRESEVLRFRAALESRTIR